MLSFLALGDSYTIGEQVLLSESFPYQAEQKLRKEGFPIAAPEIIARTGWTTDELATAIEQTIFHEKYDLVTLLIGVNNQYRGRSAQEYKKEFESILLKALLFAEEKNNNVYVLSIPDWGITPFAKGRDEKEIAAEIDAFNAAAEKITLGYCCNFIDITQGQRTEARNPEMLAADGLHPSGKEYKKWAEKLAAAFIKIHSS